MHHLNAPRPDLRSDGDPKLGELAPAETRIFHELLVRISSLSPDIGNGVFARDPIRNGSVIVMGGGQVISDASKAPKNRDYIGVFDEKYFIAPIDLYAPTPNWLINHSCDPNTKIIGRLAILARRDIAAGEELTLDYSTVAPCDSPWTMACKCGAPKCRGTITNEDWKNGEIFHKYFEEWPAFIQKRGIAFFERDK